MIPQDHIDIIEHLATAICIADTDLKVVYINPSAEILFSTSIGRAQGLALHALFQMSDEVYARLHASIETGENWTEHDAPLTVTANKLHVDLSLTPLGRVPDVQALLLEMTATDRKHHIVHEAEMESMNQSNLALARGLAHEIKNPLGGLRGAAQLLERALDSEALKEYTTVIIKEADRLKTLVDSMLGPNTRPDRVPTNIHELTEHVRLLLESEITEAIAINTDYDPSLPDIDIDRKQITQVLINLARNAMQSVQDGGKIVLRTRSQRKVTMGRVVHRLALRVDIIDDGPGIPEAIRSNIFLPMITGRPNGTGLGLPIAQTLAQQNNGLIEYSEDEGKTIFSLLLPLDT